MSEGDRRSPDASLFRELYIQLHELGRKVDGLAQRMEEVAATRARVEITAVEVERLRDSVDTINTRIMLMETASRPVTRDESGGVYVTPGWLAVLLAVAGAAVTALWQIIQWVMDALKGQHQ